MIKCGGKIKSWKRRYFVLVDQPQPTLYYFKEKTAIQEAGKIVLDSSSTSVKPVAFLNQKFVFNVLLKFLFLQTYSLDKKHLIEIVTPERTYQAYDDDSTVVDSWVNILNQKLGKKLRSLSDPELPDEDIFMSEKPITKILLAALKVFFFGNICVCVFELIIKKRLGLQRFLSRNVTVYRFGKQL